MSRGFLMTAAVAATLALGPGADEVRAQARSSILPTFRSAVDLVSVAAVVRDRRGQVVRNLRREDFRVLDGGVARPIVEFSSNEAGAISVALVVDVSGSMATAANLAAARRVVDHLLAWMQTGADEVALFTFDRELHEIQPFTTDPAQVRATLATLDAWGMTSMWDAIGETARRLQERTSKRRAIIVLTDGDDNASRLTADRVASVTIAADMPVYVVAVVAPIDRPTDGGGRPSPVSPTGQLGNLTYWTGGSIFVVSDDLQASEAARTLLVELRHQYVFAFESAVASSPGWRPLDVRLERRGLSVRARSGYYAALARRDGQ